MREKRGEMERHRQRHIGRKKEGGNRGLCREETDDGGNTRDRDIVEADKDGNDDKYNEAIRCLCALRRK